MGASRDLIDAATLAPSAFETWGNEVSSRADGSGAVSATAEGLVGDDSTLNDTAFAAAVTKAGRNGKIVFDESGTYRISADVEIPYTGFTIEGANGRFVRIRQVTANQHCFSLIPDATYDFTNAVGITLRNLRLTGPGGATTGVGIWTDPAASTYQGAYLTLDDIHVESFDIGVRLRRFDNVFVHDILLKSCRVGWHHDGNANTIHIVNGNASSCTEDGFIFGDGAGCTFHCGDMVGNAKCIRVLASGQVTLLGGNFESASGTVAHIDIENNGKVIAVGQRFLKGTNETPGYRVAGASLIVAGSSMVNFTTAPLVDKITETAVTVVLSASTNLSGADRTLRMSDGASILGHAPFPQRIDNSVPTAAVANRGLVLAKSVRDSASSIDDLILFVKDRSSGSDAYSRRSMGSVMRESGSPEGVHAAPVGTLYVRTDGGTGTTLYVKESGTGNTGWVAK